MNTWTILLQTIFEDLPRLASVTSDEWLSVDQLLSAGLRTHVTQIPLTNPDGKLKEFKPSPWVQRPSSGKVKMYSLLAEAKSGTLPSPM